VATKAKQPVRRQPEPKPKRFGLAAILLTIALSTGLFAALGVLAAHVFH
jgi:hypothetical protein